MGVVESSSTPLLSFCCNIWNILFSFLSSAVISLLLFLLLANHLFLIPTQLKFEIQKPTLRLFICFLSFFLSSFLLFGFWKWWADEGTFLNGLRLALAFHTSLFRKYFRLKFIYEIIVQFQIFAKLFCSPSASFETEHTFRRTY